MWVGRCENLHQLSGKHPHDLQAFNQPFKVLQDFATIRFYPLRMFGLKPPLHLLRELKKPGIFHVEIGFTGIPWGYTWMD